jgi:hypothetical protein
MIKESLKLKGRIVSINPNDQSFCIESAQGANRLRVYARNSLYQSLSNILSKARFDGAISKKETATFYIQGRVLIRYEVPSKTKIENLYLKSNQNTSVLDFVKQLEHEFHQEPPK